MRSFHEIRLLWRQQAWRMSVSLVLDICTWVSSHSALCPFQLWQIYLCFPCATWEGKGVILLLLCQVGDQGSLKVCPGPHPLQSFSLKGVSSFKGHCLGGRASASHDHPPVLPLSLLPFLSPSSQPGSIFLLVPQNIPLSSNLPLLFIWVFCVPPKTSLLEHSIPKQVIFFFFIPLHSVL